ncbi:hypothetical protein CcaverHIS002_0405860 [Cutaneotrichosporon cavernicola]|uniref:Uncharacterized protein n=1 Tax=Cutaneotrichosporon cavernicola TaxID=279322 RepID=A0AA48L4G4_9TREE|nr:uncharacterized protein CcaverHIS019_0405880 [Cutaneotrichosporon cavernicola]BEI83982.1 hypothetical protein CcaverHIS002_0405860 [Cutaneotrichosporon cavernicola]BEI91768.1 hypothetical protein CcaverHIS019_0405880 [Cutaneotrichosporon cavernicola]BEI99540.1 hypothetical protein CcaverHIS631_0405830 [Cutaneotrichosporon cavernicola]BEJ07317.1 hypothetical protein CcaverHIS641_0405860 [Cutaneotrichosporon cavernicola]
MAFSWAVALCLLAITIFIVSVMTAIRYIVLARQRRREAAMPNMLALPSSSSLSSQSTLVSADAPLLPKKPEPV